MDRDYHPSDVFRKVVELIDANVSFALALVLSAEGSTPQEAGVRAVIDATGKIWGTLGGGSVEAEAQRHAVEVCRSQRGVVFDFRLDNVWLKDSGPICGGSMRILLDPTAAENRLCYAQAADALQRRERGVLLTTLAGRHISFDRLGAAAGSSSSAGSTVGQANRGTRQISRVGPPGTDTHPDVKVQWLAEEAIASQSGFPDSEALRSCLVRQTPRLFVKDSQTPQQAAEVFVEPLIPKPLLLIAGGGHVGQALAVQALQIGFEVAVLDDRPEFTDLLLFPKGVTTRCGHIPEQMAAFPMTKDTYVVIVTRGHQHDAEALRACIRAPAAYIGMIGSKRKVAFIHKSFIELGLATEAEFSRVFAPIGLDIGAVTVPEIATSIAAQLVAVRRKGSGYAPPGRPTRI